MVVSQEKLYYPFEYFNSIDVYQEPVNSLKTEKIFSKIKNNYPNDSEIEGTKEMIKLFNNRNGAELTKFYLKRDAI